MGKVRNVLFMMADQLRWDYLGCTGHKAPLSPNLDRLAARGVLFDRCYVQSPVCGPSRMSTYTGRYVSSHRATWIFVPLPLSERMMGDYLRLGGRDLTLIGKSHFFPDTASLERLGGLADEEKRQLALEGGFEVLVRDDGVFGRGPIDTAYATYLRAHGYDSPNPWHDFANSALGPDGEILSGRHLRYAAEPARVADEHGESAYITDRVIDFIRDKGDEPWCAHASYIKPHWPYVVSAPYNDMFSNGDVKPVNRSANELDQAHPVYQAFVERDESREFIREEVRDTVIPVYMGLVRQLDDHIGRLLNFLETSGRMDDTLIVFTSDHGDYLGDHWLGEKELFHDEAVRVPLIVYDPDQRADCTRGRVDHRLVEGIDLLPTFLDVLEIDAGSEAIEGLSLRPVMRGEEIDWRDCTFSEIDYAFHTDVRAAISVSRNSARAMMAFDGRWKYIHFESFPPQLFDLKNDPGELCDLGADAEYAEIRSMMHERLFQWMRTLKQRTTVTDDFVDSISDIAVESGVVIGQW